MLRPGSTLAPRKRLCQVSRVADFGPKIYFLSIAPILGRYLDRPAGRRFPRGDQNLFTGFFTDDVNNFYRLWSRRGPGPRHAYGATAIGPEFERSQGRAEIANARCRPAVWLASLTIGLTGACQGSAGVLATYRFAYLPRPFHDRNVLSAARLSRSIILLNNSIKLEA